MTYIKSCVCFLGNSEGRQELEILGKKKKWNECRADLAQCAVAEGKIEFGFTNWTSFHSQRVLKCFTYSTMRVMPGVEANTEVIVGIKIAHM